MFGLCTLFSGSSANCTLVVADKTAVLVDAGGGVKKTEGALNSIGLSLDDISAIFITHEHSDHISGLKTILKYHRIPVIGNRRTLEAVRAACTDIDDGLFYSMSTGGKASKGDLEVVSFEAPHDSVECVGYRINTKSGSLGVSTDLGHPSDEVVSSLKGCKAIVFESNHDVDMLRYGKYPYILKQRIESPYGHLSNDQCGKTLPVFAESGTESVILAHLSKDNNTPELAFSSVRAHLSKAGIGENDMKVFIAPRDTVSEFIKI